MARHYLGDRDLGIVLKSHNAFRLVCHRVANTSKPGKFPLKFCRNALVECEIYSVDLSVDLKDAI